MTDTAIFSITLFTIVCRLVHNHAFIMHIRHLMHAPLLVRGSGKTSHCTLQRR